jgi:CheY-like chemotaxis protein
MALEIVRSGHRLLSALTSVPGFSQIVGMSFAGESAVELATKKQYDLILISFHLGAGIDGIEAAR